MQTYRPVLNVYIIWHPDAYALCQPLAEAVYFCLNRDPEKPFARALGIPTFFRCVAEPGNNRPLAINLEDAEHSVIFVLVEDHLVVEEPWADYIAKLYVETQASSGRHLIIPVALTDSAFNLHPDIAKANFVRLFNFEPGAVKPKLIHYIIHALARLLENAETPSASGLKPSPLPIKLFISHTKREAKALALAGALKQELDNTQVDRFFDSVDIASGYNFDEEIEGNIGNSALIAIRSDRYSDSPWCRMEVMTAKRLNRPMIVVDALQDHEDRSFPHLSNVPSIRFDLDMKLGTPKSKKVLHAIIDFALLEVLRFMYTEKHFAHLKACARLPFNALLLSRPPEERDLRQQNVTQIIYPDPPLGFEEKNEFDVRNIQLETPTTLCGKQLGNWTIGISISESDSDSAGYNELQTLGLSTCHLQNAMLEIARQCLAQGAQLVYGGDLRPNGFTENLLELVRHHNDALKKEFKPVVNYLAWPLKPTLDVAWAAQHKDAIKIIEVDAPADLHATGLIKSIPRGGDTTKISPYVWARSLTAMREQLVHQTQARIMMGGKTLHYSGKYPGLVEEALLTLEAGKPLFLLGGYGGAARVIIDALQGKQPKQLTQVYQCTNKQYAALIDKFKEQISEQHLDISPIDYQSITKTFANIGVKGLNNGLDDQENHVLFNTINIEEAVGLILKGLSNINNQKTIAG